MPYWYQTLASWGASLQRAFQRLLALRYISRCLECSRQGLQGGDRGGAEQHRMLECRCSLFGFSAIAPGIAERGVELHLARRPLAHFAAQICQALLQVVLQSYLRDRLIQQSSRLWEAGARDSKGQLHRDTRQRR